MLRQREEREITAVAVVLGRIRFVRALKYRPYALLWIGQTISALGDGAYFTALAWLILLLSSLLVPFSLWQLSANVRMHELEECLLKERG